MLRHTFVCAQPTVLIVWDSDIQCIIYDKLPILPIGVYNIGEPMEYKNKKLWQVLNLWECVRSCLTVRYLDGPYYDERLVRYGRQGYEFYVFDRLVQRACGSKYTEWRK